MGSITLRQAAAWCGGTVEERYADTVFYGACNDTRELKQGQLFVVLQGARDGHDFIPNAMAAGAAAVLCTRAVGDYPAIYVEDTRIALGKIAAGERERIGMRTVAITGSVGKSTTKEMTARVLETTYRTERTPANHNNDIGMPMAILDMPEDTEVAVLEMGMNHFREIAYLSGIGRPDAAVIVNIGTAHMEYLGSREGIRQAKMEILEGMEPFAPLMLNGDDAMLRFLPETPAQPITYFGTEAGCDVYADHITQGDRLFFTVHAGKHTFPVALNVEGTHYVSDALAAVAVGLAFQVTPGDIVKGLESFRNMAGRQELHTIRGVNFIKDCYNAGPESMSAALTVLGSRPGRRVAILGEMLELGSCTQAEHYKIGRIAAKNADLVLAYGPSAARVITGCLTGGMGKDKAIAYDKMEQLLAAVERQLRSGDQVLVKGSHGMHMEEVLDSYAAGKDHKTGGNKS